MIFCLYTDFGALNSKPIFEAFANSLINAGHKVIYNEPYRVMDHYDNYDVAVIWSILWNGRMSRNKQVWDINRKNNKPVIVLEVGGIQRGLTWKVGINGINRKAFFGPTGNNSDRANLLGLKLKPWNKLRSGPILLCGQHDKSEQWTGMPSMTEWMDNTISEIRKHTNRPIHIRPHPRCPVTISSNHKSVTVIRPQKLAGTYDDFNYNPEDYFAVINWSSNPACQAVISGIPVFVGPDSLAYDVGNHSFDNIDDPIMPDRSQWLNDYAHTEYTQQEIADGLPLQNLTKAL